MLIIPLRVEARLHVTAIPPPQRSAETHSIRAMIQRLVPAQEASGCLLVAPSSFDR